MKKVVVIGGDGVGPEVTKITVDAISKLTKDVEFIHIDAGYDLFRETGESFSNKMLDAIDSCDCVLMGAISVPFHNESLFRSPIEEIARRMDLNTTMKAVSSIVPDVGHFNGINTLFVREYESYLASNEIEDIDGITLSKRFSFSSCKRMLETLREYMVKCGIKHVTCVHDRSYYKDTDAKFISIYNEVMSGAPFLTSEATAREIASEIALNPKKNNTIVGRNPQCDMLAEEAACFSGGTQLVPACVMNAKRALFIPVHGSELRHVDTNTMNPTASLLCGSWMLRFMGMDKAAGVLHEAIRSAYKRGIRTPDVGGNAGTKEFGNAILKILDETPLN